MIQQLVSDALGLLYLGFGSFDHSTCDTQVSVHKNFFFPRNHLSSKYFKVVANSKVLVTTF